MGRLLMANLEDQSALHSHLEIDCITSSLPVKMPPVDPSSVGRSAQHNAAPPTLELRVQRFATPLPTASKAEAADTLDSNIQALPQELQDAILDMSDIFGFPATVSICNDYKPPIALQLSHRTRAKFAPEYYRNTVFEYEFGGRDFLTSRFPYPITKPVRTWHNALLWLRSLRTEHQRMITTYELIHREQLSLPACCSISTYSEVESYDFKLYMRQNGPYHFRDVKIITRYAQFSSRGSFVTRLINGEPIKE